MHTMDTSSLQALLNSWGLPELFPQFQDENIGIDELKMMKCHHIGELLHSHKLGTRIRFEYYFERWRRDQNQPLHAAVTANHYQHYTPCPTVARTTHLAHALPSTSAATDTVTPHKSLQTRATNTAAVRCVNVATNTSEVLFKMPTQNITPPPLAPVKDALREMPHLMRPPSLLEDGVMLEHATNALSAANTAVITTTATPATTTSSGGTRLAPQFQFLNDTEDEVIDNGPLLHILNSSGFKGISLLEYYQQHQHFTNVHRTLLIQLIVNFFDMNEYHLSLKVSHNLELQILKLFPSEKLEYYRTEKRGKIYVKFCNMKRYKRDKPAVKRKWMDDVDAGEECGGAGAGAGGVIAVVGAGNGNRSTEPEVGIECGDEDVEDLAQSFEYWHAQHSPTGVQVKTESLSDGDY